MVSSSITTCVTDMDGTLLMNDHGIHPKTKKLLITWQNQGGNVILATGRIDFAIKQYIHELQVNGPIISCNGALIRNWKTNEMIYMNNISINLLKIACGIIDEFNVDYHIYTTDRMIGKSMSGKIKYFYEKNKLVEKLYQVPITITENCLSVIREDEYALKILIISDNERLTEKVKHALSNLPFTIVSSGNALLDITNAGINKGQALQILEHKGYINLSETIAFGDNENDHEMLSSVRVGVAMENALLKTKEYAKYITASNEAGGVGIFLENLFQGFLLEKNF